ncbi:hypothetical protein ACFV23_52815, partial [Streptomyces sp. NPDC059627]
MTGDDGGETAAADAAGGGAAGTAGVAGASESVRATGVSGAAGVTGAAGGTEVLRAGALRDPWSVVEPPIPVFLRDPAPDLVHDPAPDLVHDPDEVTVQNDVGAVRIQPTGPAGPIRSAAAEASRASAASGASGAAGVPVPVFVDESGRRSRRFRRFGMAVGLACAVYAVVIVVTLLSGSSDAPWLPVPGQHGDRPAGTVDDSPRPAHTPRS